MKSEHRRLATLLSVLALEGILITDPIRPWLPFSLWTLDHDAFSAAGLMAFVGLALLGGMLPVTFPGLRPLPVTFPLIGTCLILYGLPPAAALAALTLLVGSLVGARIKAPFFQSPSVPWPASLAGIGLGLILADTCGYVLPFNPTSRGTFELQEILGTCAILAVGAVLSALVARGLGAAAGTSRTTRREWMILMVGAPVSAAIALAAAQAVRVWGVGPVELWLLPPFAAAAPLAAGYVHARRLLESERRHGRTTTRVLEALALAIEAKDRVSASHLRTMRALAVSLGRRLGMDATDLRRLELAAMLHDIGKLCVPEWILSKPGRLNDEEFEKMTAHSELGGRILDAVDPQGEFAPLVRHHHEHYDGTGYPAGIAGLSIPLGARILAVVDAMDSIMSERAYHHALGREEAMAFIESRSGSHFDPRVVKILVRHYEEIEVEVRSATRTSLPIQETLDLIASSNMELYSLHEIGQALGKNLNVEEALALIATRLSNLFHFTSCAVYVVDRERRVLVARITAGRDAEVIRSMEIPFGEGPSGWAAREGRSIIAEAPSEPMLRDGTRSDFDWLPTADGITDLPSCVSAPLMAEKDVLGVITLYDSAANSYTAEEESLLAMVSRQVTPAVRTGLLFERSREHTLTDFLTGLPNQRYMFVAMDQELTKARQTGEDLTILMMDIDGFAVVNEEHGHPAGDRFLIGVSKVIRSMMRDRDTCVRYSGDEFVAILPGVGREKAMHVMERIRSAVESFSVEVGGRKTPPLTISIGSATFSLDGATWEQMLAASQDRLSREKTLRRAGQVASSTLIPFRRGKDPGGF
jgi:diguanylate cyclase (GGDEF)-like protein